MDGRRDANQRWSELLAQWAIPETLMAGAPATPYFFDPAVFVAAADAAISRDDDTPSDRVARHALPAAGSVLDVGSGAGAASLRLGPAALVGVDPSPPLLDAFGERAARLGIAARTIAGTWPDAAPETPVADVVVCHHVVYNVADLAAFASALDDHARRRVVIELTAEHPMAWMAPYWAAIHGLTQPSRPTAADAVAVLAELGLDVHEERWSRPVQMIGETGEESHARIARRLCLPPERHDELRALLAVTPAPAVRDVVTLWW